MKTLDQLHFELVAVRAAIKTEQARLRMQAYRARRGRPRNPEADKLIADLCALPVGGFVSTLGWSISTLGRLVSKARKLSGFTLQKDSVNARVIRFK